MRTRQARTKLTQKVPRPFHCVWASLALVAAHRNSRQISCQISYKNLQKLSWYIKCKHKNGKQDLNTLIEQSPSYSNIENNRRVIYSNRTVLYFNRAATYSKSNQPGVYISTMGLTCIDFRVQSIMLKILPFMFMKNALKPSLLCSILCF